MKHCLPLASAGWVQSTFKLIAQSTLTLNSAELSFNSATSILFLIQSYDSNQGQLGPELSMLTYEQCCPLPESELDLIFNPGSTFHFYFYDVLQHWEVFILLLYFLTCAPVAFPGSERKREREREIEVREGFENRLLFKYG